MGMDGTFDRYGLAVRRALDWAGDRVQPDGVIVGSEHLVFGYYKALLSFWAGGRPRELGRLIKCVRREFYADGAFDRGPQYPGASVGPTYREAWLVWGCHMAGAYDMSLPGADRLQRNLDPQTGGAFVTEGSRTVDWGLTCAAIAALLATGRVEQAVRAGGIIGQMIEAQPDPDRMVMRWNPGEGLADPASFPTTYGWIVAPQAGNQVYWYLGFALYAFARLHAATGDRTWLSLADRVLVFVLRCEPDFQENMNTSKLAWGAAQMFAQTGDERYRSLALGIADWMVESQTPEGVWVRKRREMTAAEQPVPISLDASLDRAFYLTEVISALA